MPYFLKHIFLLCKYFAAISVASSVQVTLQFYFQIFYNTTSNKIAIKLTKLKRKNVKQKCLEDIKELVIKTHLAEEIIEICSCITSADKNYKNIHKGAL